MDLEGLMQSGLLKVRNEESVSIVWSLGYHDMFMVVEIY
jgi:hypothetical protein